MIVKTKLLFEVDFTLNEQELKALDALAGYGTKEFLECFYKHIGKHYLSPHEAGIVSLFEKVKMLKSSIVVIDQTRKALNEAIQKKTVSL